jgi:hypothetical protein
MGMELLMTQRDETERDFALKTAIRTILWSQGYSTRLDVLLAYDRDLRGKSGSGKAGLTDLDVLGIRLDPGFKVHVVVADCKTTAGQVPERLFWLSGVGRFFGSDTNMLVRSKSLPEHAPPLARSLDITLVGPDDLEILTNIYVKTSSQRQSQTWQPFFSPRVLSETLSRVSRLPSQLKNVELYRETLYWMDEPYIQLQRIIGVLQQMSKEGSTGPTFQLVFADFVWLYVISLWKTLETLAVNGFSRLRRELELYLSGNEAGVRNLQRVQRSFEALARRANVDVSLPLLPPYFNNLCELVTRCARRPEATAKMARRAEWLLIGQIMGGLGSPPWETTEEDLISNKLLGDIAQFLVEVSGLKASFLNTYLSFLQDQGRKVDKSDLPAVNISSSDHLKAGEDSLPEQTDLIQEKLELSHPKDDESVESV